LYFGRLGKKFRFTISLEANLNTRDSACDNVAGFLERKPKS